MPIHSSGGISTSNSQATSFTKATQSREDTPASPNAKFRQNPASIRQK